MRPGVGIRAYIGGVMSDRGSFGGFWHSFWGLWSRWTGAGPRALPASTRAAGDIPSVMSGMALSGRPPARGTAQLLQAYGDSPRLRSVIAVIVDSLAAVPWRVHRLTSTATTGPVAKAMGLGGRYPSRAFLPHLRQPAALDPLARIGHRTALLKRLSDQGATEALDTHPAVDLLYAPIPGLTAAQVRQTMLTHIELVGEGFLVVERGTKTGRPRELWPVPPPWVRELPRPGAPWFRISWPGQAPRDVPAEDVIWLKKPNPANPYDRGSGVGATLNNEIDADEFAARTTSAFFLNNATPDLLITMKGTNEQAERVRATWLQNLLGYQRAKLPHITNAELDVKQLSSKMVDMDLANVRGWLQDCIRMTYGVPPEIIGDSKDSNRSTSTNAQALFIANVLIPRLDAVEDGLNASLMPLVDPSGQTVLLYDSPEVQDLESEQAAAAVAPYARTLDEWRIRQGEEPYGDERGAVHMVPFSLVATRSEDLGKPAATPAPATAPVSQAPVQSQTNQGTSPDEGKPEQQDTAGQTTGKGAVVLPIRKAGNDARLRQVLEALDPGDMAATMGPLWRDQLREWITTEMRDLGADESIDVISRLAEQHMRELGGERIGMITETTREALSASLAEGMEAGETTRDLIARVRDTFGEASDARAELIARTETCRSSNWAITAGQQIAGITRREWLANPGARETHAAMNGQIRAIDAPFNSPSGDSGMYPGGFSTVAECAQCRCTVAALVDERGLRDRGAVWKAFDARLAAWDRAATAAVQRGFARQERAVSAAVMTVFGKSAKRGVR